jgi:hypothetical protein
MAIVEQTARETLAEAKARIGELEQLINDLDIRLETAQTHEGRRLIRDRADGIDELEWQRGRLAILERAAKEEEWSQLRDELNAAWKPLAERRVEATRTFQDALDALLATIPALTEIDAEQRSCLRSYLKMDRIFPQDRDLSWVGVAAVPPVQRSLNALDRNGIQHIADWFRGRLAPYLPEGGRRLPETLINSSNVEFRERVISHDA